MHDIAAIKDATSLLDVLTSDGLKPRTMGGNIFICCPFHHEDTPSCKVTENKFHCFGCGTHGDVIDYWAHSRGMPMRDAIAELAGRSGLDPLHPGTTPPKPRPKAKPRTLAPRLDAATTAEWLRATKTLADSSMHIERIAQWRGYSASLVQWAAEKGIMGLYRWSGVLRETFLVERPTPDASIPVSMHVRLGAHTKGNETPKASWRYYPSGCGSWPLVLGQTDAPYVFLLEGEWDALALIDIMGWHQEWPTNVCVIGIRGATTFKKLLHHFTLSENAVALIIADSDEAGSEWLNPGGLVDLIAALVRTIHFFQPAERKNDFNDLLRDGLTRDLFLAWISGKLPSPHHRRPTGPTFLKWCKSRQEPPDTPTARVARAVIADKHRPKGRANLNKWVKHWRNQGADDGLLNDLRDTWDNYLADCQAA